MKKNKHSIVHFIVRLFTILPLCYRAASQFLHLIETETSLAGKKVVLLLVTGMLFLFLLISTWGCLIGMIFLYFVSLHLSYMLSMFIVFILNLLLLIITGLVVLCVKNEPLFPKTRKLLFHKKE